MAKKKKAPAGAMPAGYYARQRKGKGWKILLILLLVLVAAAAIAAAVVWNQNTFTLSLAMAGEQEITLEYGDRFQDPGAQASFSGSLLLKEPQAVAVTVEGNVDTKTLGSYTLTYDAAYTLDYYFGQLEFHESCQRVVQVVDTQPPVIALVADPDGYTIPGQTYVEEGFIAYDNYDRDITYRVLRNVEGDKIRYTVADSSGNLTKVTRQIVYHDPIPPELTLKGDATVTFTQGGKYAEPGYSASDNCDGDITDWVKVTGTVDPETPGTYTLEYSVTDSYDNTVTAQRTVVVKEKPKIPELPAGDYTKPVNPSGKTIYLTFDDGPGKYTAKLLDILDKYNVKATFFVVSTGYMHLLPRMAQAGHTVAMHSATHDYSKIYADEAAYFTDLKSIQDKIAGYIGYAPTMLRFPGGSSNTVSRRYNEGIMTRLTQMVDDMGYRYFDWNVSSGDAGGGATTAEEVYARVISGVSKFNTSIVLQHDIKGFSVDAVEWIIQWGHANGYTFRALTNSSPICEHRVNN